MRNFPVPSITRESESTGCPAGSTRSMVSPTMTTSTPARGGEPVPSITVTFLITSGPRDSIAASTADAADSTI